MSAENSTEKPSVRKGIWTQWDKAWDLNLPVQTRLEILQGAVEPSFVYLDAGAQVLCEGDLPKLAQIIEDLLEGAGNNIIVKHIKWWEHHDQSALQWDMININTGVPAVSGWTHAEYAENGKLSSVSDFY